MDCCCRKQAGQNRHIKRFRRPKGSGSALILILNLLVFSYQQGAGYNLVSLIVSTDLWENKADPWLSSVLSAVVIDGLPKLLYPIAGWLSDAKLGRYKLMRWGMWIMWIAAVLLLLTSIVKYSVTDISSTNDNLVTIVTIPVVVGIFIISAIGTACFHVNVIPFGIDQLEDGSSEEICSFIHWYYWTRNMNFGILVQFAFSSLHHYCSDTHIRDAYDLIINLIQLAFLTGAICLDFLWCKRLNIDPKLHNPIKKVKDVSLYIAKHNKPINYRSAYTYTTDSPASRSDFAKTSYGGIFSEDDVEDVTAFWRIVAVLVAIGFCTFLTQSGTYTYPLYLDHFKDSKVSCSEKYIVTNFVSIMTFTTCIPIFEFIVNPLFRNFIPKMTLRIGLGMLLTLIGHSSLFIADFMAHHHKDNDYHVCLFFNGGNLEFSPYYLVPIIAIMSIGELLMFISVLEFMCAQSPYSMRGLIIGMSYFIYALFSILVALVILIFALPFKHNSSSVLSCGDSYLLCVLVIGGFGLLFYIFIAKRYKKRQRGGQCNVNPHAVVEHYFENGRGIRSQMYLQRHYN